MELLILGLALIVFSHILKWSGVAMSKKKKLVKNNYIFLSGDPNPFKFGVDERRFFVNKNKKPVLLDDSEKFLDWFERCICVVSVITIVILVIK